MSSEIRLSREVVLREALTLLDEVGDAGLTMRALAARLDVVPMALYRHVSNKQDLIDGVLDLAVSLVSIPSPGLGWRAGLRELARSIRATALAHPGIVGPLVTRPSLGPHGLVIGEFGLAVMRAAGFDDVEAQRAPNAVLTYTLGFVALEVPRRHVTGDDESIVYDADLSSLPADRFPHTVELRPRPADFVSDDQFDHGLELILDGVAARVHGTPNP